MLNRSGSQNRIYGSILIALACVSFWLTCTQSSPIDPTQTIGGTIPIFSNMEATPSQIIIGNQSIIRVRLVDHAGNAITGAVVTFQATLGTVDMEAVTDNSGWAVITFRSGQGIGEARITAKYLQSTSRSVTIQILSPNSAQIQLSAANEEIYANGLDHTTLTLVLGADTTGTGQDRTVALTASMGTIQPSVTLSGGTTMANIIYTGPAFSRDTTVIITAAEEQNTALTTILLKGIQFTLMSSAGTMIANGESQATITAIVKETRTQIGIPSSSVYFGTSLGTIPSSETTDISGIAQTVLVSSTNSGTAAVVGRYGNTFLDTVLVDMVRSDYLIDITPSASSVLANGMETISINVHIQDQQGQNQEDVAVHFHSATATLTDTLEFTSISGTATTTVGPVASVADETVRVTVKVGEISQDIQLLFTGISFKMEANPTVIVADGQSQSVITATLKESVSRIGISDAEIRFGSNLGTIPSSATTDDQGRVLVHLISGQQIGLDQVVGFYGNLLSDTVIVQYTTSIPPSIQSVSASPQTILANGTAQSVISAKVVNSNGSAVSGTPVSFIATYGTIESQALTNSNGIASVVLTSVASTVDIEATVTARISGSSAKTVPVTFQGISLDLTANPVSILADGRSLSTIRATLKKTSNQVAIPGESVYFGATLGYIPSQSVTNQQGVAQVSLQSGTQKGTAKITVHYGNLIQDSTNVIFTESIPTYINVSATPKVIPADNQSQSTIKAIVSDANLNPVPDGTLVTFDIVEGAGSIEAQKTTSNGVASSLLTSSSTPDTAKVLVKVGELVSDTVEVIYNIGEVTRVDLNADPTSIPADGVTTSKIRAYVTDILGNPASNVAVQFTASIGNIASSRRTDENGIAEVEFSSTQIGLSDITGIVRLSSSETVTGNTTVDVLPGSALSITLSYAPSYLYVRDCGKNQTVSVFADVRDEKNNPVEDGTYVQFAIFASPGFGDYISTNEPVPTVGGIAQVTYNSGTRAGTARIQAQVTDRDGNPVEPAVLNISTEIVVYSGPPYIENVNDASSSHLTITTARENIWSWLDTTLVSILVGDKYNNPVQENTAVYLTTSGGVVTTQTFTDSNGVANVLLESGNPLPVINRYYNYIGLQDPNTGGIIPGPIPDMEGGRVLNSEGGYGENDGIVRILAHSEGIDENNESARAWAVASVIYSRGIPGGESTAMAPRFTSITDADTLNPGEYANIIIELWDVNGNPVVGNSILEASLEPTSAKGELSWETLTTGDPGTCYYYLAVYNTIDPTKADDRPGWVRVMIHVTSVNGVGYIYTDSIYLAKPLF